MCRACRLRFSSAGRKAGQATGADRAGAQRDAAEMMSQFRPDADVEMLGMHSCFGWSCLHATLTRHISVFPPL